MYKQQRREHPRCSKPTTVTYQFLNKSAKHRATARNYSRYGMYFEAHRPLSPSTLVVIRSVECSDEIQPEFVPVFCQLDDMTSKECNNLKTYVVAEVKRCDVINDAADPLYGIAVKYVSPAS